MLTELYQYAMDKKLSARPGFKQKSLKAYVVLSSQGEFLDILVREKGAQPVYAPDIGAAANGTRYCNFLVEKAKIPLRIVEDAQKDKNIPTKSDFYLSMLEKGGAFEPRFLVVAGALRDETVVQDIREALKAHKLKAGDAIGFLVDGMPLERSDRYLEWWEEFRTMFAAAREGELPRCLITGELAPAMATVPKVSGLIGVGGHTAGDAFLCFDKDAFQSYGLKKSANAPVSEEAMTAVNAALTKLIAEAPTFGAAKMVHWYSCEVEKEEDPIAWMMDGDWDDEEEPLEVSASERAGQERAAMRSSRKLLGAVDEGLRPDVLSARYYILPLSGASGRMMVRGWYEGEYSSLYGNIVQWFDDLTIPAWDGKGKTRPPKLKALCTRLLKPGGDPTKLWSRMDDELPNLQHRLLYAIIQGTPLPDDIPVRVLHWIRSAVLESGEDMEKRRKVSFQREQLAFQLLNAWLCRKKRQRGVNNVREMDKRETRRDVSYDCGRMMAVYVAIQHSAMPEMNAGIAERYYTAASTNPAFAVGRLSSLSQHHLSKLKHEIAEFYERKLEEIYAQIGERKIPAVLTLEQQSEFALGYYQQRAELHRKSREGKLDVAQQGTDDTKSDTGEE